MTVIVIADIDGNDLVFRLAADNCKLSKMFRLRGKAGQINGNPYLVYGKAAARWMGMKQFTQTLVVATMSSGSLIEAKPHNAE
jgi:hypothetical protein